jgi:hypothetical protein
MSFYFLVKFSPFVKKKRKKKKKKEKEKWPSNINKGFVEKIDLKLTLKKTVRFLLFTIQSNM